MPIAYTDKFSDLWNEYPRRVAKLAAFKEYTKVLKLGVTHEELISSIKKFADHVRGTDEKFIPHFRTWLSQGRWEDELQTNASTSSKIASATAYERAVFAGVMQSIN